MVRKPADLLRYSLSAPIKPPTNTTSNSVVIKHQMMAYPSFNTIYKKIVPSFKEKALVTLSQHADCSNNG
jgi:hypothetical protein